MTYVHTNPIKLTSLVGAAFLAVLYANDAAAQVVADDVVCAKCVDTSDIAAGAVKSGKIAAGAVKTGKIANKAVTAKKLAAGAVRTGKIAAGAVTAAKLAADAVFSRIIVVRNDPADNVGNCNDLVDELAAITDNDANNRYLIWLEPGIYDCGSSALTNTAFVEMKPFVDIEGSGQKVTKITGSNSGSITTHILKGADNSELRNLTVENTSTAIAVQSAIGASRLDGFGMLFVTALAVEGAAGDGLTTAAPISVELSHVTLIGSGRGVRMPGSATGPFGSLVINNSFVQGNSAGISAFLNNEVTVRNSVVIGGLLGTSNATTFNLISTQLVDPVGSTGTYRCVGAYDGNFAPLDAACQ